MVALIPASFIPSRAALGQYESPGCRRLVIGEALNAAQLTRITIIFIGLFIPALNGRKAGGSRSFLLALLIGATIAIYSLTDGIDVHIATTPFSYIPWLIFNQAVAL